jgi:high-affinity Fe2+/Pb2+ permease
LCSARHQQETIPVNAESLAPLVAPVALAGTLIAALVAAGIAWRYRNTRNSRRLWRRRNWRLMQFCALTSLFYLALAASSLVLKDLWGWLYLMLAIQVGTWWLRRFLTQRPAPALRR